MKHNYAPSLLLGFLLLLLAPAAFAQLKVGDNPGTINKASVLELESGHQGLLLPRIADTTLSPSIPRLTG
ncbi:hypothetical protein [Chitinophaga sp. CB10]|uniref:hypothetical protein n=1 Tax=Chitinophaga sp. CB10 TaxID=1891659 RepID=UPI0025C1DE49|nr:hypothetical protein [Chitinophaga sp. CB10]